MRTETEMPRCYESVLDTGIADDLLRDVELVDNPDEAETFWLASDTCPTTSLEKIVKAIFDFHTTRHRHRRHHQQASAPHTVLLGSTRSTPHSTYYCPTGAATTGESKSCREYDGSVAPDAGLGLDLGCGAESGAEWWVQQREEGYHADLGMPFHWDKDENMLEQEGVVACPAVSTVTYLTGYGAPTVVLEARATGREGVQVDNGDIERAFVSYPALFKHLAFDGGFLHGVPEQLMRQGDGKDGGRPEAMLNEAKDSNGNHGRRSPDCAASLNGSNGKRRRRGWMRVTLLVNVWLSHKPTGIAPLPASVAASLSNSNVRLRFDRPVSFVPVPVETEKQALLGQEELAVSVRGVKLLKRSTVLLKVPLGPNLLLQLRAPTCERLSASDLKEVHSFALVYARDSYARISIRPKEEAGSRQGGINGESDSGNGRSERNLVMLEEMAMRKEGRGGE